MFSVAVTISFCADRKTNRLNIIAPIGLIVECRLHLLIVKVILSNLLPI